LNQDLLAEDVRKLGVRAVLKKPFEMDDLVKTVTGILSSAGSADQLKLTEDQINDLMEVANIGVGNAAAHLSDLIHHRCVIEIPGVIYLDVPSIKRMLDQQNSYAVALHMRIMGDVPALMFVIMRRIYAQAIVNRMLKTNEPMGRDLSFTAQFALKQLGELLTTSFSDAISNFLKSKAKYSMPQILVDMWSTALDAILAQIQPPHEEQLVIRSAFFDPEKTYEGQFVYILNPESQRAILHRIKMLLSE
jgi:chemotaxis protein CheC